MNGLNFGEPIGQGWAQFAELGLALVLSAIIGLEREIRQKSAGLRTYTLVGLASALILLVSKYGFTNVLVKDLIVVDPSRVAAQIVTGIGFIGGGVIFVRKDIVRGLNTAATIWVTSAVGMACGAGLPFLALAVTAANFVVIFGFPLLERRLPKSRWSATSLTLSYQDGRGILREILVVCTQADFALTRLQIDREDSVASGKRAGKGRNLARDIESEPEAPAPAPARPDVTIFMELRGSRPVRKLVEKLGEIEGVTRVDIGEAAASFD